MRQSSFSVGQNLYARVVLTLTVLVVGRCTWLSIGTNAFAADHVVVGHDQAVGRNERRGAALGDADRRLAAPFEPFG